MVTESLSSLVLGQESRRFAEGEEGEKVLLINQAFVVPRRSRCNTQLVGRTIPDSSPFPFRLPPIAKSPAPSHRGNVTSCRIHVAFTN